MGYALTKLYPARKARQPGAGLMERRLQGPPRQGHNSRGFVALEHPSIERFDP